MKPKNLSGGPGTWLYLFRIQVGLGVLAEVPEEVLIHKLSLVLVILVKCHLG
jgi:hypothetical protein